MAPYDFEAPDADTILRCSDEKELRVHKLILSLASPVFREMFSLPQPEELPSIPIVDISEDSDTLIPLIQYLYPHSPPHVSDLDMWEDLYTTADEYDVEVVMEILRNMLIPQFLRTSPFRVYALASHWGFDTEAKLASRGTLVLDISKELSEEDAELMGISACRKLYHLHIQCRGGAQAWPKAHPNPFDPTGYCKCSSLDYNEVVKILCLRAFATPWITVDELYGEITKIGKRKERRLPRL